MNTTEQQSKQPQLIDELFASEFWSSEKRHAQPDIAKSGPLTAYHFVGNPYGVIVYDGDTPFLLTRSIAEVVTWYRQNRKNYEQVIQDTIINDFIYQLGGKI